MIMYACGDRKPKSAAFALRRRWTGLEGRKPGPSNKEFS